jgi:preprotein translocase subunit YajC
VILAQDPPKGKSSDPLGGAFIFLPLVIIALYFIIVILPGKRKQEKERQSMITNLKKNDRVLTIAGIYGTFVSSNEGKDEIVIKVDDGTRLTMTRGSILRNITAEEAAKAQKAAPEQPAASDTRVQTEQK